MKKYLGYILLLLLGSGTCMAQFTTVSATVTDSDTTVWAAAPYSWSFQPGPNQSNPANYTYNGAPLTYLNGSGAANGSGVLSISSHIYDVSLIRPIGASYNITVCPNASSNCSTINFKPVGGSVSLTSQIDAAIHAPRFLAVSGSYGYIDAEAIPTLKPGSTYWNTTSSVSRCYTGSAWGVCSTGGGGSGTVSPGTTSQIAVYPGAGSTVQGADASTLPQTVAWEKKGTVIVGGSTDATTVQEPTVFSQPVSQITTNVPDGANLLGMFHTLGYSSTSLNYEESLDGVNWVGSAINISGHLHSCEATIAGTIYILAANSASGPSGIDIYSFISGTPTLVKANIVTNGGAGWRQSNVGNCGFWKDLNGIYYLLYDGQSVAGNWSVGLATCTAPSGSMSCTDYGSNPVISSPTSGGTLGNPKSIRQLGASSYIVWLHGTPTGVAGGLPTDGYFATASSPSGPWTISPNSILYRTQTIEGANTAVGQVADLDTVDFNGACYNFFTQFPNGTNGINGGIGLAISNLPCNQLVGVAQTVARPAPPVTAYPPTRVSGANASIGDNTVTNFGSIVLTQGTWLLNGTVFWETNASSTVVYSDSCISTSSSTCTTSSTREGQHNSLFGSAGLLVGASGYNWSDITANYYIYVSPGATSTQYIVGSAHFTGTSTISATGILTAFPVN